MSGRAAIEWLARHKWVDRTVKVVFLWVPAIVFAALLYQERERIAGWALAGAEAAWDWISSLTLGECIFMILGAFAVWACAWVMRAMADIRNTLDEIAENSAKPDYQKSKEWHERYGP